jgi:hypothetical protein
MPNGCISTVRGANFASSPAPPFVPMFQGFPTKNLVGLYLLQDGALNQPMPGSLTNSINGSLPATRVAANPPAVQRAYGMELNPANQISLYNTGLPITQSFTILAAGRYVTPSDGISRFLAFIRPVALNTININIAALSGNPGDGGWGGFLQTSPVIRDPIVGTDGHNPGAMAFRFNGDSGDILVEDHLGRTGGGFHPQAIGFLKGKSDIWSFGFYASPGVIQGELYVIAMYDTAIPDARVSDALTAARNIMITRGLTPSS